MRAPAGEAKARRCSFHRIYELKRYLIWNLKALSNVSSSHIAAEHGERHPIAIHMRAKTENAKPVSSLNYVGESLTRLDNQTLEKMGNSIKPPSRLGSSKHSRRSKLGYDNDLDNEEICAVDI